MVNESALRNQRLESIQENEDGSIPTDGNLVPFADVIDSIDWSPDVPIEGRRGVGSVDLQKHDRGSESHTFTIGFDLQGVIAAADIGGTGVNAEPVLEAIVRKANNELEKRTVLLRETHEGDGVENAGRHIWAVARHAKPNTLTLSGDPANGSPISVELEYLAPKARSYILDQPGSADTIDIDSTDSGDSGDIKIRGVVSGSDTTVTVTMSSGSVTTTDSFEEIYEIELVDEFAGDLSFKMTTSGNEIFKVYGKNTYWGVEGDKGIPLVPESGSRVTDHGGDEQRFRGDTINFSGSSIAEKINSAELEVANNIETQASHDRLGMTLGAGTRDITLSATVFGEKKSHENIDQALRKITAQLVWTLDLNTVTMDNAIVSDPGSRSRESEETFANTDVEFEPKTISIS